MMSDKIFKIGILILSIIFLVVYYFNSQVNRYQLIPHITSHGEFSSTYSVVIFDTKQANIYLPSKPNEIGSPYWIILEPMKHKKTTKEFFKIMEDKEDEEFFKTLPSEDEEKK
jgi:hypothetical protein